MHNRYVLTEIGGIAVQHGLDRSGNTQETDDLTLLSEEHTRTLGRFILGKRVIPLDRWQHLFGRSSCGRMKPTRLKASLRRQVFDNGAA